MAYLNVQEMLNILWQNSSAKFEGMWQPNLIEYETKNAVLHFLKLKTINIVYACFKRLKVCTQNCSFNYLIL